MPEIQNIGLEDELQSSYIDYAMSVIIGRAIPEARDGLKPVQRRILYAMYNIKNFHDQPTKKSARIVGECFAKNTLVLTDKGLIPIQDVEKGSNVYTQNGLSRVTERYIMPKRRLLNVRLENGVENIVTPSQQFKVLTRDWQLIWKEAKDLQQGDYILTKSLYPEISKQVDINGTALNENVAYLLGQLLSDGFVINDNERHKYHRIGFCSTSKNIIKSIVSCLEREFGYTPTVEEKVIEYNSTNGQLLLSKIYQIRVNNQKINKFFINNFSLLGCVAWTKRIPDQIFRSPINVIFEFLSGLIDGDGHVHKDRTSIEYSTTSKEIATQLTVLLQHLGISSKKYETLKKENTYVLGRKVQNPHDSFSVEINGVYAQYLASKLTLREEKKNERAGHLLRHPIKQSMSDIFPWANEKIFIELSKYHIGSGWYVNYKGEKFRNGIKYKSDVKIRYSSDLHTIPLHIHQIVEWGIQDKLAMIKSPLSPFINSIIDSKINFSAVTAIDVASEDVTYDIQVEDQHEFIANGMVSHNCLGKYHPHGDIALYEALARMAQSFSMNHILVEGQGNFGSIDGDPPAAQRYTEVRLTKLSEEILADLDKETVDFVPNFDNTESEPIILPSKVPNLLLNGATGIAVGVATNMPPHNLNEICDAIGYRIDHKESTVEDLLTIIKGPDFPTGGIAIMSTNAYNGYKYGRGQLALKAKAEIDEKKRTITITNIPYNLNKSNIITGIVQLVREKKIIGLKDIRDESDKSGIRIIIDFKDGATGEQVLNMLYKHTQLQITVPLINLAIVGKSLKSLNLLQMLDIFLDHRRSIILKRSQYDLKIATDRLHIVEGLLVAIGTIDEIIKTIKASREVSEARKKLMERFTLSEKQASAILEMKLSRLTHLENDSLANEKKELEGKISYFDSVIKSPEKIDDIIKADTLELKEKYGRPRRTEIVISEDSSFITNEDTISDEKVTIILTNGGYVKELPLATYREQARGGKGIISINLKEGDYTKHILTCNNKDYIICVTNTGRIYWLKAYNVPEGSRYSEGKAIVNLLNTKDEKVIALINIKDFDKASIVFLTSKGIVKKTDAILFSKPRSTGVRAITLNNGDEIVDTIVHRGEKYLTIATKNGKSIKFEEADVREIGRSGMGVRGIRMGSGDVAMNIIATWDKGSLLTITENGYGKLTDVTKYRLQGRGGSGVKNIKISDKTGPVAKCIFIHEEQKVVLISSQGVSITFPIGTIRVTGRVASGVRLMRLEAGSKVVDAMLLKDEAPPEIVPI